MAKAALDMDTMAVPADPENPEMNSVGESCESHSAYLVVTAGGHEAIGRWKDKGNPGAKSNLDDHHMVRYTPIDGYPPTERLCRQVSTQY